MANRMISALIGTGTPQYDGLGRPVRYTRWCDSRRSRLYLVRGLGTRQLDGLQIAVGCFCFIEFADVQLSLHTQ
jgi:hypothetical protein